jgi:hypothetical protein
MESNQTAMRQLLNQLREERNTLPMDAEWNRCFQAIESVIESKYIPIEKEHMKSIYIAGRSLGRFADPEDYYTSTYGS